MKEYINKVKEFHVAGDHDPEEFTPSVQSLRSSLIEEEWRELNFELIDQAYHGNNIKNILKESADLLYVIFGAFIELGIEDKIEEAFSRVHESNMSKCVDGKLVKREDGKILKGENYKAPDLSDLV